MVVGGQAFPIEKWWLGHAKLRGGISSWCTLGILGDFFTHKGPRKGISHRSTLVGVHPTIPWFYEFNFEPKNPPQIPCKSYKWPSLSWKPTKSNPATPDFRTTMVNPIWILPQVLRWIVWVIAMRAGPKQWPNKPGSCVTLPISICILVMLKARRAIKKTLVGWVI